MPIPDQQLQTWAHQGSVTQSKTTHEAIRSVLNSSGSPYYQKSFDDFLQGSYANNTNIYADSDVDIVIRLRSTFYDNTNDLQPSELELYNRHRILADYELSDFKRDVVAWLRQHYTGVTSGEKAIFIPGNDTRRNADVLVSAEHRHFTSYSGNMSMHYDEGIVFETANGRRIVNYPRQHRTNLSNKNQATDSWLKSTVRVFKNMRNRMIQEGYLGTDVAPSYFIEGLLYNVPDDQFGYSHLMSVTNCINFIQHSNCEDLTCANELHWLVRDYQDVCWSKANFEKFRTSISLYWDKS